MASKVRKNIKKTQEISTRLRMVFDPRVMRVLGTATIPQLIQILKTHTAKTEM